MPLPAMPRLEKEPGAAQRKNGEQHREKIHHEWPVAAGKSSAVQIEKVEAHLKYGHAMKSNRTLAAVLFAANRNHSWTERFIRTHVAMVAPRDSS